MANYSRRLPPPPPNPDTIYYPVPQNTNYGPPPPRVPQPASPMRSPDGRQYQSVYQQPSPDRSNQELRRTSMGRRDTATGVARGELGGGLGPYARHHDVNGRDSAFTDPRFSAGSSPDYDQPIQRQRPQDPAPQQPAPAQTTATIPAYLWDSKDPEPDDILHNPDPVRDARLDASFDPFSLRGWANVSVLFVLVVGLIVLFAGYPIIVYVGKGSPPVTGFNFGGVNGTGQLPVLPGVHLLIDPETPQSARSWVGTDGLLYSLVFSDEFNEDGRTFWPGDDPYWEAVDLHYWPTGDLEWYHPSAITTEDGKLVITMTEQLTHRLNFQSGMLQSWNKFCFTTGYIEISISLPGSGEVPGNWAAAWTMGNLGRAGYGATTEGMWPYTYDTCDTGTFPNQTDKSGYPPENAGLSYLPGQRLSRCSCPGSEHPGPTVDTGRGAPEIDIIEAQVLISERRGEASQSAQTAPFDYQYQFNNASDVAIIYDPEVTKLNNYKGGRFQQAVSALTLLDNNNYNGTGYEKYGFEYWSDPKKRNDGFVTWYVGNDKTWTMKAGATGANPTSKIGPRMVSEEPMSIILNFGMSPGFQGADFRNLIFPQRMYVDYVRVYQRSDSPMNVGCDPPNRPTADYIEKHLNAYTNPNLTTWDQAGYKFPRNSLYDGC